MNLSEVQTDIFYCDSDGVMSTATDYIKSFASLRSDTNRRRWPQRTKHRAPHKPLLLLSVIDLFAEGAIKSNLIELTPDLCETFTLYWSRVMPPDQRGNIALPFSHLKSDGFWHLVPKPGKEEIVNAARGMKSASQLRELVLGARLDDKLYDLLRHEEARNILRAVLIETYFVPEVQAGLAEQGVINQEAFAYSQELLRERRKEVVVKETDLRQAARDQGFRRAIVTAYQNCCAFCGIRVLTADGHTVVDAAHIVPWSLTHNDSPNNGMALCRLCHWSFDEGMLGVSAYYLVLTSPQLFVSRNAPGHLITLSGRRIGEAIEERFRPDLCAIKWHRQKVFRNR